MSLTLAHPTKPFARPVLGTLRHAAVWACGVLAAMATHTAQAQPAGWTQASPFNITESSGATLTDYQIRLVLDTASMVTAGQLRADAADLRFGTSASGGTLMDYYIERGVNTASTVVWVKVPSIPASATTAFFIFSGNPAATSASTVTTFDYTDAVANSATQQVVVGQAGGVTNSQRGFRFKPNQDILVTDFGKYEPSGTTRYLTLFDVATQAKLAQQQVSGPANTYTYAQLAQPLMLTKDTEYIMEIYQGASDGYYFGSSTQINPVLTYLDMRYCNGCTQDTFPTNFLNAIHYGFPDFQFRTTKQVTPAPVYALGSVATTLSLTSSSNTVGMGASVTLTATVSTPSAAGTVTFLDGGTPIAGCSAVPVVAGAAQCTTSDLPLGARSLTAVYDSATGYTASTSAPFSLQVTPLVSSTAIPTLSEWGMACMALVLAGLGFGGLSRSRARPERA